MRFVHVSDTHIASDAAFRSAGHSPLDDLEHLVDSINALEFPIQFVLHTGDVTEDGSDGAYRLVLFSSAPSGSGQFFTWPGQTMPRPSPGEPAGFNLVTVTADTTIVRQHFLPR